MNEEINKFFKKQLDDFVAFRKALTDESDRGCALFAAAFLDKALSDLLYLSLVANKKIESDLFDGNAPLASFSARIKMAFYLGKISKECRADLDTIRSIRNKFAHHAEIISFDDKAIADQCKSLRFSYQENKHRARGHFTAAVSGLLAAIQKAAIETVGPEHKPDDSPTKEEKAAMREKAKNAVERVTKRPNGEQATDA
ncbi:MltR family transcriptional regulator [Aquabacterium sp. NJ1]|uniref:MltR family transcriptional regulator n=1 Tax=Aquabacterium sp. NJ1 TaxID=1538295 RepID=UPI0006897904|nr:MltR family transcriptional regulator [Aquabacterium sp. NJ1]